MDVDPTFVQGLTLQQYYFGVIMQGVASRDKNIDYSEVVEAYNIAKIMLEVADADS